MKLKKDKSSPKIISSDNKSRSETLLLIVTGGIAAYKIPDLVSSLVQRGELLDIILTQTAEKFVSTLALESLTRRKVFTHLFDFESEKGEFIMPHIELSRKAKAIVIAPATANFIGNLAHGLCPDLATTTLLAAKCPVLIFPGMNSTMYQHPAVQKNLKTLEGFGYHLFEPETGFLACREEGEGRLPSKESILKILTPFLSSPFSPPQESN